MSEFKEGIPEEEFIERRIHNENGCECLAFSDYLDYIKGNPSEKTKKIVEKDSQHCEVCKYVIECVTEALQSCLSDRLLYGYLAGSLDNSDDEYSGIDGKTAKKIAENHLCSCDECDSKIKKIREGHSERGAWMASAGMKVKHYQKSYEDQWEDAFDIDKVFEPTEKPHPDVQLMLNLLDIIGLTEKEVGKHIPDNFLKDIEDKLGD